MEKAYRVFIEATLMSELPLEELQGRLDVGLLKYSVNDILPDWEKQSISLEWYELLDYAEFRVELDEEFTEEINS